VRKIPAKGTVGGVQAPDFQSPISPILSLQSKRSLGGGLKVAHSERWTLTPRMAKRGLAARFEGGDALCIVLAWIFGV